MIRAGQLRERIVIQSKAMAQSASGAQTLTWTVFAQRNAKVQSATGREQFDLAHTKAEQVVRFTIRYLAGVTEQMRILHGGTGYANGKTDAALVSLGYRIHAINSVSNVDERDRRTEITATLERK